MKNAEHPITPEDVQAWVDGEFNVDEANAMQAHLASCQACTDLVASLRSTSSAMQEWQVERAASSLALPVQHHRRAWLRWAVPAAAMLLLAVIVWPKATAPRRADAVETRVFDEPSPGRADMATAYRDLAPAPSGPVAAPEMVLPRQVGWGGAYRQGQRGQGQLEQGQGERQATGGRPAMVVRTATLSLLVADLEKTRASLDSLVKQVAGFVGQMDTSGGRGEARWLTTTLRVPEQRLSEVVGSLRKLGTVQAESQGGEDVTSEATDLDARLANARETEKRLVTVLQQRTGRVADVLEVEREIARVRESIEQMTSQRQQLRDRVTYATISLRVTEETKASLDLGPSSIHDRFRNALVEGTTAATEAVLAITLFVVRVAPSAILLILALGWPVLTVFRRLRAARPLP